MNIGHSVKAGSIAGGGALMRLVRSSTANHLLPTMHALSNIKHQIVNKLPTGKKHHAKPSPEQMATATRKMDSLRHVLMASTKGDSIHTIQYEDGSLDYVVVKYGPKKAIKLNGLLNYVGMFRCTNEEIHTSARDLARHDDPQISASAKALLKICKKHRGPWQHTNTFRNAVLDLTDKLALSQQLAEQNKTSQSSDEHVARSYSSDPEGQLIETSESFHDANDLVMDASYRGKAVKPQASPVVGTVESEPAAKSTVTQPPRASAFEGVQDPESVTHARRYAALFEPIAYSAPGYMAVALQHLGEQHGDAPPYFNRVTGQVSSDPDARQADQIDHAANYRDFANFIHKIGKANFKDEDPAIQEAAQTLLKLAPEIIPSDNTGLAPIPNSPELVAALLCIATRREARYPFHLQSPKDRQKKYDSPYNHQNHIADFTPPPLTYLKHRYDREVFGESRTYNYDSPTRQAATRLLIALFAIRGDFNSDGAPLYYEKLADGGRKLSFSPESLTSRDKEHARLAAMQFSEMVLEFGAEYSNHADSRVRDAAQVLSTIAKKALSTEGGEEPQPIIHASEELEEAFATIVQFGTV